MRFFILFMGFVFVLSHATHAYAEGFTLKSTDIAEGQHLSNAHVFKGFGCEGDNLSPALSWSGAPEGTKSYAINVYDPDAPTGSGWWHWTVLNIPASVTSLVKGSGAETLPAGSIQLRNDYGVVGFGGACPPPQEVHRYHFTVYALGVETLDVPADASNALAGFMIRANALDSATITAVYTR